MKPSRCHDEDWSVFADWLEDQDMDASDLRNEIAHPPTNGWCYESRVGVGGGQ